MKRSMVLLFLLWVFQPAASAQLWSGVLSSPRAADWTQAGFPGSTLPSVSWTQCGATITPPSSTAAIAAALASCGGQNKFVLLGPGTFTLGGQIAFPTTGHVALRGSGADSTFIVITGASPVNCQLHSSFICAQTSDVTYFNQPQPSITGWTAGYAKGTTQITLSSVAGISTTNPTMLFLEQCETGYTAASPTAACTGMATNNNQLFICSDLYSSPNGCSSNGPGNQDTHRGQFEMTYATNVAGNVVTVADPLLYPNWASGQTPRAWLQQPIVEVGVENLSLDNIASTDGGSPTGINDVIQFFGAYQWWVSGVKITNFPFWAVETFETQHGVVKDSYFYHSTGTDSYAIRFEGGAHNLVQNNIIHQVFAPVVFDGPSSGNVVAYNFTILSTSASDSLRGSYFEHGVNAYELYEGNVATNQVNDGNHGTANFITRFRNFFFGWESCGNGQCGASAFKDFWTNAFQDVNFERYENTIGNVLGTPGFHTAYQTQGLSGWNAIVEVIGGSNAGIPADLLNKTTSMFWGNYDTFNAATRFLSAEVPSGISPYPNTVPASQTLPASFYLSSKPSWFGAITWPPIGPDVSSGNIGQCSGTLNVAGKVNGVPSLTNLQCGNNGITASSWSGHVNATPAMNCFLTTMGGSPDGTGSALSFNASTCYAAVGPPVVSLSPTSSTFPNMLVGIASGVQAVTLTNTGASSLAITSISLAGTNPGDFSNTTTCGATLAAGANCAINVTFLPTTTGARLATVSIVDSASGSPHTAALVGFGLAKAITGQGSISGNATIKIGP